MSGTITSFIAAAALLGGLISEEPPAVSGIRYEVTFDAETAALGELHVEMSFRTADSNPVLLSMPAWTPGSYEMDNFARNVRDFEASSGGTPIRWDMVDFDTWRVFPPGPSVVTVAFDYRADDTDVGAAWSTDDFAYFNGTNVFLYPEGQGYDFSARVTILTESDWKVATGMRPGGEPRQYAEGNYHDLVDMPFVIGRIDVDSAEVEGRWYRLATYPEGILAGGQRATLWEHIRAVMPPMSAVFGDTPWDDYTIMAVFDDDYPGASALEHANSHLGFYASGVIGAPFVSSILAHEIFHAWNVKRLRPQDMWPYAYDHEQPTTLLWVSEGITDYYADLAMVRGGVYSEEQFYETTAGKIDQVASTPPVALEDASLSTWIAPTDGTAYIYYPKGSLAGFMLDILIRDATDNRASLDDVMRDLYESEYGGGSGFTEAEWWAAVSRIADGMSFEAFFERYIDGRDPYPWDEILPLAGLRYVDEETMQPRLGVQLSADSLGVRVMGVVPGGSAAAAGVREGDFLLEVGDVPVDGPDWADRFRARYVGQAAGTSFEYVVLRDGSEMVLAGELRFAPRSERRVEAVDGASGRALRIRNGILTGSTD